MAAHLTRVGKTPNSFTAFNTGTGFVTQGTVAELRRLCGLDARSIVEKTLEVLKRG